MISKVEALHGRSPTEFIQQLGGGASITADHPVHGTALTKMANEGAGIHAADSNNVVVRHPLVEGLLTAPVAWPRGQLTGNHATGMGVLRLLILRIHPGVSQLRIRECDQLTGVTRIRDHLLISRHSRVEHHLPDHRAAVAKGASSEHGAICQNEMSCSGR